ncbi:TrmH family RNA methyltransferase [Candidatus Fokinia crypta]|uniref:23S rRNA (Guanosine-2'-O-)-methyltransferase RlmB n=1 Tax=Candidatus Fokinia crypta TaxID=1920990 RepID=A0ABZ0UP10_9RICK|nr:RNA methyltransferase [Candidatus Fokinia cryptica]WPX97870.1 23S rRNA (guanosine-2'-O-)-methyltransferase RlmB [Candidatus Fokinia cryptica]
MMKKKGKHNAYWIYGKHSVVAAMHNPAREKKMLVMTKYATRFLHETSTTFNNIPHTIVETVQEFRFVTGMRGDVVHQGIALRSVPLKQMCLEEFLEMKSKNNKAFSVILLDKVTDPYNIGAIIRSCAAFGVSAVITTRIDSPDEMPIILKVSCGGFEKVSYIKVSNLVQAINTLKMFGFIVVGLSSNGEKEIDAIYRDIATIGMMDNVALVFGNEEVGMRVSTEKSCNFIAKIGMNEELNMPSINVSNAGAIVLYTSWLYRQKHAINVLECREETYCK